MIKFTMPHSAKPEEIRDAIKCEVQRRLDMVQKDGFATQRKEAEKRGERNALESVVWMLERIEFIKEEKTKDGVR